MGKGGNIDVYLDCNSPWSCFAYHYLRYSRPALLQHGVEVSIHPIFLGGVNVGSGNKPPWTLPAKAVLSSYEMGRGLKYFAQYMPEGKVRKMSAPAFFPILSLLPMRCMLYVKDHFPAERYEDVFGELWVGLWERHEDLSKPEGLGKCLRTFFDEKEVAEILEGGTDPKYKKMLVDETAALVEKGAFGAPWFRVTRGDGVEEPFFGSDRFHFMFDFLGVPYRNMEILLPKGDGAKL